MIKYVLGFMFNTDMTEVLLIEKQKPAWQKGNYNGVGGKIEETDLSYLDAMIREFKEETGIEYENWKPLIKMSGRGGNDWECYVYYAFSDEIYNWEQREVEKLKTISMDDLHKYPLISNLSWLIPMCCDKIDYVFSKP